MKILLRTIVVIILFFATTLVATQAYTEKSLEEAHKVFAERFRSNLERSGVDTTGKKGLGVNVKIKTLTLNENAKLIGPNSSKCELDVDLQFINLKTKDSYYSGSASVSATGSEVSADTVDANGPALETCIAFLVEKMLSDQQIVKLISKAK